jgi:YidC/Oxa1 family membrane protein insertase
MEQSRLMLAIALSFAVLFIWSFFFVDTPPEKVTEQTPTTATDSAKSTNTEENTQTPEQALKPLTSDTQATATPEKSGAAVTNNTTALQRTILVSTPLYDVVINEKGARFDSFTLHKYHETVAPDSAFKEVIRVSEGVGTLELGSLDNSIVGLREASFVAQTDQDQINVSNGETELRLLWSNDQGVAIERKYRFSADTYLIQSEVTLQNLGGAPIKDNFFVSLKGFEPTTKNAYGFEGPSGYIDESLEQIKVKKIEDNPSTPGKITWVGIEDRYFLNSILPAEIVDGSMGLSVKDGLIENRLIWPVDTIGPQSQKVYAFDLYFGPKKIDILKTMGHNLEKAVNFGMFDILARPCLWLLNFLHGYIPNFGIAIIILTLLVKLLLWPLGSKSYKSMNDMRKLQPLMSEIREKYKDDKKMMNQELMGLYKTYKINPMGGCLPMVVQIPVFFGLYRMLYQAIELRHAPFMFWINDLSAPDRLFEFGFSIPFMQPPFGIPVLTIVMGASMLLQQKMSPPPGDPTQAKMMMFMPIVFTFIFINFSSGLVLYWLTNNILSISQQYYIQKRYA